MAVQWPGMQTLKRVITSAHGILLCLGLLDGSTQPAYPHGHVDDMMLNRLTELLQNDWQPCFFVGSHECILCPGEGEIRCRNVFLPGNVFLSAPR